MESGSIKWFSPIKGYGFITKDDGTDVFVHSTGLALTQDRHLFPGDTVEFEQVDGDRGPKALSVKKTASAEADIAQ
ncbi:MAG: cold-shock protein [Planctomycetes bacterium]|nr:cold-shock protein [Planctomycetota bacterium]